MSFFEKPILNTPYAMPDRHWDLDGEGRPTDRVIDARRRSELISAMPQSKSRKGGQQDELDLSTEGLGGLGVDFNVTEFVNEIRREVGSSTAPMPRRAQAGGRRWSRSAKASPATSAAWGRALPGP